MRELESIFPTGNGTLRIAILILTGGRCAQARAAASGDSAIVKRIGGQRAFEYGD